MKKKKKKEVTAEDLRKWLKNKRILLDCGHRHCQHIFSNTMIVHEDGKAICHS